MPIFVRAQPPGATNGPRTAPICETPSRSDAIRRTVEIAAKSRKKPDPDRCNVSQRACFRNEANVRRETRKD